MKKLLALTLALLLTLTCVVALSSCKKDETKKVILGFDAEYPPFGYLDEATGNYVGFDIDYAKEVCKKLGYELELKPIDWNSKDGLMDSGAIDFIWNGFTYEGRENDYEWTDRYLNNSIVVLVSASSGITSIADLAGKAVAVQSDSSGEEALKGKTELVATFKSGAYSTEPSYTTAFEKLKTGAIDAIVVDVGVANYLIANNTGFTVLTENISTETYGVGFKKGNTALRDEFNTAMKEVAADTEFIKRLCSTYGVDYNAFLLGK